MRSFCSHADIICPNVTEAAYLTGIAYEQQHTKDYVSRLAYALADTGARTIIVTGLADGDMVGSLCLDTQTNREDTYMRSKIPGTYYGTGDIFASVIVSAITVGLPLSDSLKLATDFVYQSILSTQDELGKYDYGVKFEQNLNMLTNLNK